MGSLHRTLSQDVGVWWCCAQYGMEPKFFPYSSCCSSVSFFVMWTAVPGNQIESSRENAALIKNLTLLQTFALPQSQFLELLMMVYCVLLVKSLLSVGILLLAGFVWVLLGYHVARPIAQRFNTSLLCMIERFFSPFKAMTRGHFVSKQIKIDL